MKVLRVALGSSSLTDAVTVLAVLAVSFGAMMLIMVPSPGGRLSVALLAPIVAWLALPGPGRRRGRCPSCNAAGSRQVPAHASWEAVPASQAAAPDGKVLLRHGWDVTWSCGLTCSSCGLVRQERRSVFVAHGQARSSGEAVRVTQERHGQVDGEAFSR